MTQEFEIQNEDSWSEFWNQFLLDKKPRLLILLEGEVGAGKTTSIRYLARAIKADGVSSPSFAIHQKYQGLSGTSIDHVDLYRIESESELEGTGFWDLFSQKQSIVCVEWPSRVAKENWPLGWDIWHLEYKKIDTDKRLIITQHWS